MLNYFMLEFKLAAGKNSDINPMDCTRSSECFEGISVYEPLFLIKLRILSFIFCSFILMLLLDSVLWSRILFSRYHESQRKTRFINRDIFNQHTYTFKATERKIFCQKCEEKSAYLTTKLKRLVKYFILPFSQDF